MAKRALLPCVAHCPPASTAGLPALLPCLPSTPAAVLCCCSVAKGDRLTKELAAMRSDEELLTSFINSDCAQIQGRTGMRRMQAM